jgi:hypothetical protein
VLATVGVAREATGTKRAVANRPGARFSLAAVACPVDYGGNLLKRSYVGAQQKPRRIKMDRSSQQLLVGTFAYLVAIGGLIAALGAAFGS